MENPNDADALVAQSPWATIAADDEIAADLAALGLYQIVNGETTETPGLDALDLARRDALASSLLRREAEEREEIARTEASLHAELELLQYRYATLLEPRRRRADALNRTVCAIAEHTMQAGGYPARKKSRDVGAGTYGYRTQSETVELVDEAAFITWAEANAPELLRVKLTLKLEEARQYLTEAELANTKREIVKADAKKRATIESVPGYVDVPERHTYYAEPLPAAAIHGARV